jgi:hypothetical protein
VSVNRLFPNEPHPHCKEGIPLTKTILALSFMWIVGMPCHHFSPTKHVESWWILKGRHSAVSINSEERARDTKQNEKIVKAWSFLYFLSYMSVFKRKYNVF